jgi:dihydroflavonol-4-reductase
MTAKRVLVTGGCGFIGRHLAHMLRERGDAVRILDIDPVDLGEDIEIVAGSILDEDLVAKSIAGVEQVYHLAANPNLWLPDKNDFYRINTQGTEIVLAAARKEEVARVVYTSTESILKGTPKTKTRSSNQPIDERVALSLDDMPGPYCRSKYLAEERAMAAAREGLPVVIVNPTLPIGPGDRRLTPPTRMLLGFLSGRYPAYLDCAFNMIDARDAALGHILAAERGRIGERYILGGENLFLHEVLAILGELSGRPMPRRRVPYWLAYTSAAVAEAWSDLITKKPPTAPLTGVRLAGSPMTFDCTKTVQELGLRPRCVRKSLEDTLAWFVAEGYLSEPRTTGS